MLFSTERFESFHGVFRAASVHSNHHAPSRDIAETFVGLDYLKHVCSGELYAFMTDMVLIYHFKKEAIGVKRVFGYLQARM